MAEDYWRRCEQRAKTQGADQATTPLTVMEWGAGNGNLAACFLDRLQELDQEKRIFPRVTYRCLEREPVLLEQAKANTDLAKHRDRVTFDLVSIEELSACPDGSIDRIICNELWSELPTKLILRKGGEIHEEQLRPNLNEKRLADFPDWPKFIEAFAQQDIESLNTLPSFLEDLVWEREIAPSRPRPFRFAVRSPSFSNRSTKKSSCLTTWGRVRPSRKPSDCWPRTRSGLAVLTQGRSIPMC